MKQLSYIWQKCALLVALLLFVLSVQAQDQSPFRTCYHANETRQLNIALTHSDTIPLLGQGAIYGLSIDATIYQPREASFTRIVLEDTNGHDYLVAESDWFRSDTTIVNLTEYCEETAKLRGVVPARLKCYLSSDATLSITNIHFTAQTSNRSQALDEQSTAEIKRAQVQSIVNHINAYNERHGKLWRAGITEMALRKYGNILDFSQESDSYLANLKYYVDGYYEFGERTRSHVRNESSYVSNFDWRNRHGRSWITPIKHQESSGLCTAFAAVAVAESAFKLYFNFHDTIDLSEYAVGYYSGVDYYGGISTSHIHYPIQYIRDYGAIDEATMPFLNTPYFNMPTTCPEGNECIRIADYFSVTIDPQNLDSIKHMLIHNGPAQSGLHNKNHNHAMTLVGYGTINPDTVYHFIYQYNKDTIYAQTSEMIGNDFWIFKNSYGVNDVYGHNGFAYYVFNDYQYMHNPIFVTKPITSIQVSEQNIIVEDNDGDGYFNWGIGLKPSHCPAWAPIDSDGDDSDPMKGPMDKYGVCDELPYNHPVYEYIANDSTLTNPENRTAYLGILRGATVSFQAQQSFSNNTKLLLDNGATLILNGTFINGNDIQPYAGSKIILNNGAKIYKPFELPVGVELVINHGNIE